MNDEERKLFETTTHDRGDLRTSVDLEIALEDGTGTFKDKFKRVIDRVRRKHES